MTITTGEADWIAVRLEDVAGCVSDDDASAFFDQAAAAIRTLAAERDLGDKQIHGLSEERERWKERAERAEAERDELRALVPTNHQTSTRWTIGRERPDANEKPRQP